MERRPHLHLCLCQDGPGWNRSPRPTDPANTNEQHPELRFSAQVEGSPTCSKRSTEASQKTRRGDDGEANINGHGVAPPAGKEAHPSLIPKARSSLLRSSRLCSCWTTMRNHSPVLADVCGATFWRVVPELSPTPSGVRTHLFPNSARLAFLTWEKLPPSPQGWVSNTMVQ